MIRQHAPLALAVLALAFPSMAQDWKGSGRLYGTVVDETGKPIAGATVKGDNPERGGGTYVTTDKKGRWALGGIAAGRWNIDVEAEGFELKRISTTLPGELARLPPLEIPLTKAAPKGPPPELVEAIEKAEAAYKQGRYDEARANYEKLLALRPELAATIHQQIGFSYIQQKEYAKGVEYLKKVLENDPDNAQIRAIAAQAALEGGLLDEGKALLAGLDESKITSADVFFNMGVNFLNAGLTEESISYFSKAIERDPRYVDGYYRRALGYLGLGKNAECRADMQKVVELDPESAQGVNAKKVLEQLPK